MGWAARANPKAQQAARREIAPKPKRGHSSGFTQEHFAEQWQKFLDRLRGKKSAA